MPSPSPNSTTEGIEKTLGVITKLVITEEDSKWNESTIEQEATTNANIPIS